MRLPLLRGQTYQERFYSKPPGVEALVEIWNESLVNNLLGFVWEAYDDIHKAEWSRIDWTKKHDDLERSLSEALERAISKRMNGFAAVYVQHGTRERESRANPPSAPPEYDIAFVWVSNPRLIWPLEAKVLKSDKNTGENNGDYIDTIKNRYLTCYYAPFSTGGAMIGYLKSGDSEIAAANISGRLGHPFSPHIPFPSRCHKVSDHQRIVPAGKNYPAGFRCHHMILPLF